MDQMADVDRMGLCLLAIDGGGVRGLSSLFLLQGVMDQVNEERAKSNLEPIKPCQLFNLIGGTSTGGLIAIMLGRLEMTVDECITTYKNLMKTVFEKGAVKHRFPVNFRGNLQPRFSSATLEREIKNVISTRGIPENERFNDEKNRHCKVFVCATSKETSGLTRIRSYRAPGQLVTIEPPTIWQAALATSAATSFFDHVSIGSCRFIDGAMGANNPIEEIEAEAKVIWSRNADVMPIVKCILSIGTGASKTSPVQDGALKFLSQTLCEIVTETEKTEERFASRWLGTNRYFRLNVQQGLQDVELAEYEKEALIRIATSEYFNRSREGQVVGNLVMNLKGKEAMYV